MDYGKGCKKRELVFSEEMLKSLAFFNGRVYNNRRVTISNNVRMYMNSVYKSDLKGLGKRIKDSLYKYNELKRTFDNLLWEASRRIIFVNEKEREDFEDKWENRGGFF